MFRSDLQMRRSDLPVQLSTLVGDACSVQVKCRFSVDRLPGFLVGSYQEDAAHPSHACGLLTLSYTETN